MPTLDESRERRANIAAACEKAGREPIPFSVMTGAVIGADEADYDERVRDAAGLDRAREQDPETMILGTVEQVVARLKEYEAAGVERIFLQHLAHRDIEMVELIGASSCRVA